MIVILAESANDLQNLVDKVYENSSNLGLKINLAKTEIIFKSSERKETKYKSPSMEHH